MFPVNCYVLWDDTLEAAVIDPGCFYEEEKQALKNFILKNELNVKHLLNTHLHLDHIFGVHDNETSMFGRRMSKAEERELKGQVGMISAMGAVASAAMKGGQLSEQEKARFMENINLANDAQTGGMALYSRRADEAFAKVQ